MKTLSVIIKALKVFILAGLFFAMFACRQDTPPSAEFRSAYIEMRVGSEIYGIRPEAGLLHKAILEKYGFTATSFSEEVNRLRSDYRLWETFQSGVVSELDSLIEKKKRKP